MIGFPLDALPRPLEDLARAAGSAGDYPPEFVAVPGLSVMAVAIGGRATLRVQRTFRGRPLVWVFTSAPPGAAKGPGQRVAVAPLVKLQGNWAAQYQEALARYKAELAAWEAQPKKDRGDEPEPPPPQRRCLVGDATLETLAPIMLQNPAGGVLWEREELGSIVGSLDQYRAGGKGAGRSSFLELHDGQHLLVDRIVRGSLFVREPRCSVVGGMVPEKFASILGDSDGLGPRFLGSHHPGAGLSLVNLDRDIPQSMIDDWDNLIRTMITRPDEGEALPALEPDQVTEVRLGSDSKGAWKEATRTFDEIWRRGEITSFGQQVLAKASLHLANLALVLHVAASPKHIPPEITGETLRRAAALIGYFIESALALDLLEPSAAANRQIQQIDDAIDHRLIPWLRRRPRQMATLGQITIWKGVGRTGKETAQVVARYGETHPDCVMTGSRREGVTKGPVPIYVFAPAHRTSGTVGTSGSHTSANGVPERAPRSNSEINTPADTPSADKPLPEVPTVPEVPPVPERDGHAAPDDGVASVPPEAPADNPNGDVAAMLERFSTRALECCRCRKKGPSVLLEGYYYCESCWALKVGTESASPISAGPDGTDSSTEVTV
ncbi:MAG: DUF3987 domain-containing protein [Candidatus Dormibacteria bacterium]